MAHACNEICNEFRFVRVCIVDVKERSRNELYISVSLLLLHFHLNCTRIFASFSNILKISIVLTLCVPSICYETRYRFISYFQIIFVSFDLTVRNYVSTLLVVERWDLRSAKIRRSRKIDLPRFSLSPGSSLEF